MLAPSEHSSAAPAATVSESEGIRADAESDNEPITQPVQDDKLPLSPDDVRGEKRDGENKSKEEMEGGSPGDPVMNSEPGPDTPPVKCEKGVEGDNPPQPQVASESVQEKVVEGDTGPVIDKPIEEEIVESVKDEGLGEVAEATSLEEEEEEKLISFERNETAAENGEVDEINPPPATAIATEEDEVIAEAPIDNVLDFDTVAEVEIKVTPPSGTSSGGEVEVVEILNNLESLKTPEPEEVQNGTVRASFVQFDLSENEGPLEEQSDDSDQDDEEEAIVDEVDEGVAGCNGSSNDDDQIISSLGVGNPELQRIREEQVRKWLVFEQENPTGERDDDNPAEGESLSSESIEVDSLVESRTNGVTVAPLAAPLQNGHHIEGDSTNDADGDEGGEGELMMNGVDGMPRRVRFLTDQEGNLLISVFMSNTPTAQLSEESSSILSNGGDEIITDGELQNPSLVVSPPSMDTYNGHMPSAPPMENGTEASSLVLMEPIYSMKETPQEKPPPVPVSSVEDDEGCNSSDETLSVSSCNSMIEILPNKTNSNQTADVTPVEPDVIIDENNNEVKRAADADMSIELDKSMSSVTTCFQLSTGELTHHMNDIIEEVTEEETASDASSSQPPSFIVHEPVGHSEGMADLNQPEGIDATPPEPVKLPIIDENNNIVEEPLRPQFHHSELISPMPELRQGTWSSSDDGDDERMSPPAEIPPPPRPAQAFLGGVKGSSPGEEQQQMVSLCIQEEHISAVALTIAKWESMSKAQSTENLSTSASPTSGHAPVSKTSSSPCPMNKVHKPLMVTLSAKPVMNMPPPPQPAIQVQQVIIEASPIIEKAPSQIPVPKKEPAPTNKSTSTPNQKTVSAQNAVNNGHNLPNGESLILGKAPGWNCWGNKINDAPQVKTPEQNGNGGSGSGGSGTDDDIIYAQPNLQAGSTMTSITNPSAILKTYPKPLSKREILMWMKEGEIQRAGLLMNYGQSHHHAPVASTPNGGTPVLVNWFFGLISRQQAERYLHGQPSGTFLVRISTRIWGYTLSYQASSGRTKHFLISATNPAVPATLQAMTDSTPFPPQTGKQQRMSPFLPQGRYAFIGTNMTPYGSLVSLIRHHSHAPITKLGGEKLINACPGGPQVAGMDALFKG